MAVPVYSLILFPQSALAFVPFLTTAILTGLRWNLIIVLTYISSMVKAVEHSSKSLLAIYIPSFENRISGSLVHLLMDLLRWIRKVW